MLLLNNIIMKVLKKVITILVIFVFFFWMSLAYSPVERDFTIAEKIEENLYKKLENNQNILPEDVVDRLIYVQNNKNLSPRAAFILDIIIEDMIHDFNLEDMYSYQEMTKDDCYEDEKYDEEWRYCYIEEGDYEGSTQDYYDEGWHSDQHGELWEENIEAKYSIFENTITLIEWKQSEEDIEMWQMFSYIIPKNYRVDFKNYIVYNDLNMETDAYVSQNPEDNTKWDLYLNRESFYDVKGNLDKKEWLHTLIHEFAHVLTLNKSQVQYYPQNASDYTMTLYKSRCNNNSISEWCLYQSAYLNKFINTFWEDDFKELQEAEDGENLDFYTNNETNFVTDYAATNPGEDIAETFTYFVLAKKPEYTTIANQKVLQLYEYPELVHLKKLIQWRILKLDK